MVTLPCGCMFDDIKRCISEIEIRMMNGDTKEQALNDSLFFKQLRSWEKEFVKKYFK